MIEIRSWIATQVLKSVSYDLFGKERVPETADEERELADRIDGVLDRTKILTFKPEDWKDDPHPKQGLFMRSQKAQIRAFVAANQVGKTWAIAAELISWCLGQYPWNGKPVVFPGDREWQQGMRFGLAGKDFINALAEDILPKMMDLLPLKEIGCEFVKIQGRVTAKITFPYPFLTSIKLMSYDMEPGKWEGYTWDGFAFNEPPPRHAYIGTKRGMIRNQAPIIFAMTPLDEPYLYEEIYASEKTIHVQTEHDLRALKQDSIAVITCDINDTPYITEDQKEFLALGLDDDEREARLHGRFLHLQGRVYKNFERSRVNEKGNAIDHHVLHAEEWFDEDKVRHPGFFETHPDWQTYPAFCVIDPHDRKPFAMGWGIVTPRQEKIFIAEWPDFDFSKVKSYKATMDEYADIIRGTEETLWKTLSEARAYGFPNKPAPIVWRIMDPNFGRAKKATTGTSVEDELADRGFYFDTTVDDDIPAGHIAVRNALGAEELFVLDRCKNMIRSFENYTWEEYRGKTDHTPKEKPRDKWKDFMDLVRYVIMSGVFFHQPGAFRKFMTPAGMKGGPR